MKKYVYVMALAVPCLLQAMQPKYPNYPKSLSDAREQLPGPVSSGFVPGSVSPMGPGKFHGGPVRAPGISARQFQGPQAPVNPSDQSNLRPMINMND